MIKLNLENYNLTLISVNNLFKEKVSSKIINHLHELKLLNKSFKNKDVKNIFDHYFLLELYNSLYRERKVILLYNNDELSTDLVEYYSREDIQKRIVLVLKKIPIPFVNVNKSIDFFNKIITEKNDESYLFLNKIRKITEKSKNNLQPTMFLKDDCLQFLKNSYFNTRTFIN